MIVHRVRSRRRLWRRDPVDQVNAAVTRTPAGYWSGWGGYRASAAPAPQTVQVLCTCNIYLDSLWRIQGLRSRTSLQSATDIPRAVRMQL